MGNKQFALTNSRLPQALVVRALDDAGQPVSNQNVQWAVLEGDGQIKGLSAATDRDGYAAAELLLGSTPGAVVSSAQLSPGVEATFESSATTAVRPMIRLGVTHQCAISAEGDAYCWGQDNA